MHAEAATWHYIVAEILFLALGALSHVCRATFNLFPDRLTDNQMLDMALSDGYDWNDWLFGTEYDDNGYYRLDSVKNFRISVAMSAVCGFVAMLFVPGFSGMMAAAIDWTLGAFVDVARQRIENPRWI